MIILKYFKMKIVVLGGGTAGWLTSLFIKKFKKDSEVILIESEKIGILGAGEGSTPNFPLILKSLNINETEFLTETKSTIKQGIDFINWRGDGNSYLHYFEGNYGYHFDARLVADYFKKIALERDIIHIIGDVDSFQKHNDNILSLTIEGGDTIAIDFIFDCSGFARLILGKELNGKWVDTTDYLTVNSAIPFFLPMKDKLNIKSKTTTKAIAMDYGWMWQIPLQHRWGCGYVFDDRYLNSAEAKKEIEEFLGHNIDVPRTIKFKSGYYKEVWKGNCIAIGLSSSFFEPLEATSLMSVIIQLFSIKNDNSFLNINHRNKYNKLIEDTNKQILAFVRHHYICDKKNTNFWKDIKNNIILDVMSDCYDINGYIFHLNHKNIFKESSKHGQYVFNYKSYNLVENGNRIKKLKKLL